MDMSMEIDREICEKGRKKKRKEKKKQQAKIGKVVKRGNER
jgi:hypothetical protein